MPGWKTGRSSAGAGLSHVETTSFTSAFNIIYGFQLTRFLVSRRGCLFVINVR